MFSSHKTANWRQYQRSLQRSARLKQSSARRGRLIGLVLVVVAVAGALYLAQKPLYDMLGHLKAAFTSSSGQSPESPPPGLTPQQIAELLGDTPLVNTERDQLDLVLDTRHVLVSLSLEPYLQRYISDLLDRRNARRIGIVVMEPQSGRVIAMVGYDRTNELTNPCTASRYPAASTIKIVTAAAAMEKYDLKPDSVLMYNGGKYTLYKRQLDDQQNRYTQKVSLANAFGQSINPIFGKLGANLLKKQVLETYADAFLFNRGLDFERPVDPSRFRVSDERFQLAEKASGFNRDTTLSPLHGAVIAAAMLNQGRMVQPTVVDRVINEQGIVIYHQTPKVLNQALAPETAGFMRELMHATITNGTCRRTFRHYKRDDVLGQLDIGGKTGSICGDTSEIRHDWFVGFAAEKGEDVSLALGIEVTHEKFIGRRANQYAKMIMKYYFDRYFAQASQKKEQGKS